MPEKYRIVSDGTASGTKVFMPSGEEMKNASSVHIEMTPGICIAHIDVIAINPTIDLVINGVVNDA